MDIKKLKYRNFLIAIAKIVGLCGLLFIFYYIFWLRPTTLLPNALRDAETILIDHRKTLIENKASITELARLDAESINFEEDYNFFLAKLKTTNEAGLKLSENTDTLPKIIISPNESSKFLNTELQNAFSDLSSKHQSILSRQKILLNELLDFYPILAALFSYNLEELSSDFKNLSLQIQDIQNRIKKISDISKKYQDKNQETKNLYNKLIDFANLLAIYEKQLTADNDYQTKNIKNKIKQQLIELKLQSVSGNTSLIKSHDSVKLLTDEANLILEYDYWIKKTNLYRKKATTENK